ELSIVAKENTLTIKGEKVANENGKDKTEVLYRGIAARAFERAFQLADFVQVKNASLENGLLHVDLVREIPEAKKPRSIPIAVGGGGCTAADCCAGAGAGPAVRGPGFGTGTVRLATCGTEAGGRGTPLARVGGGTGGIDPTGP